jgi:hypothetical protein
MDTNLFFEKYEENPIVAEGVDTLCSQCPAQRQCLAYAVSNQEWGVWGGVFLDTGSISREFNNHKTKKDWADTWQSLTTEK